MQDIREIVILACMKTLNFSITINAPREKVWNTMLGDTTYRQWTKVFNADSHFEGNWEEGSTMHFLGSGEDGKVGGMVSKVLKNTPYAYMALEHVGMIQDGKEDRESEQVKEWAGALENYTLVEENGVTKVSVELVIPEEFDPYFTETWPKSLQVLKELCEA